MMIYICFDFIHGGTNKQYLRAAQKTYFIVCVTYLIHLARASKGLRSPCVRPLRRLPFSVTHLNREVTISSRKFANQLYSVQLEVLVRLSNRLRPSCG